MIDTDRRGLFVSPDSAWSIRSKRLSRCCHPSSAAAVSPEVEGELQKMDVWKGNTDLVLAGSPQERA